MSEAKHDLPVPDGFRRDDVSRKIISDSERLFHQLNLDPESRREFEAAREGHAARVAGLPAGDAAQYVEACLDYLSELGRIATRSRDRYDRRREIWPRGGRAATSSA